MSLVSILLSLLVLCLIFWAARALLGAFSVGEPISTVVYVILVIVVVLWLIGIINTGIGNPVIFNFRR